MLGVQFVNEMEKFQREMNQLFRGDGFSPFNEIRERRVSFKVREIENSYIVEAALPGLVQEHLDISVLGRKLTVSGEIAKTELPEGANWVRQERLAGKFEQSFQLPDNLDTEKIEAHYRNGILRIDLPKAASAQPKKIEISVA